MSDMPMEDWKVEAYGEVINPPEAKEVEEENGDKE